MAIGESIKKARINACLSQKELGDMVGVTKYCISKIENNNRSNLNTLEKIKLILKLDLYETEELPAIVND